jgi:hypothetical protein
MRAKRFSRPSRLLTACLFVVGGCFTTASLGAVAPGASASGKAVGVDAAGCTDPVVHDSYDGFHIGVPAGWYLSSLSGLIVVFKDYSATTEGVVQTAFVNTNESQRVFISSVLASLSKNAKSAGNLLTFRTVSATTAVASGRVGSVVIAGEARVSFIPAATAHGSELGVVSGYWAPSSQLGAERSELASIGGCFGLQAGTLSRFVKDQWFGYTLPLGWTVGNEGPDELFLEAGPNASANFLLAGPFLASSTGITDAASFQHYCFQRLGLTIKTVLSRATFPSQTTAAGGTEQEIITEFLGTDGSKQVHGLVRTIASTGGGATSGVLRIALATPPLWDSLNGALIWDTYSIEHSFTQDLAAIQQQQEQLAGFSQQVAGFDQALNGADLVEDPATGEEFEAPYTAYSQSGPDGPGYYTGSPGDETKLAHRILAGCSPHRTTIEPRTRQFGLPA